MSTKKRYAIDLLEKLSGPTTVATMLRAYIELEDINQNELARRLGVTRAYTSNLLKGKRVSLEKIIEIAQTLNEPVELYIKLYLKESLRTQGFNCKNIVLKLEDLRPSGRIAKKAA